MASSEIKRLKEGRDEECSASVGNELLRNYFSRKKDYIISQNNNKRHDYLEVNARKPTLLIGNTVVVKLKDLKQ